MGCLFCNIVEGKVPSQIVHDDEHTLAFRDVRPMAPTHVLVIPKKHVAAVHELEDEHVELMGRVLVAARRVADKLGLTSEGYRLVVNDGDAAGQTVHHIHVHVLGGRLLTWPPG
jgi:histidine triad (HIT) family protein